MQARAPADEPRNIHHIIPSTQEYLLSHESTKHEAMKATAGKANGISRNAKTYEADEADRLDKIRTHSDISNATGIH